MLAVLYTNPVSNPGAGTAFVYKPGTGPYWHELFKSHYREPNVIGSGIYELLPDPFRAASSFGLVINPSATTTPSARTTGTRKSYRR